MTDPIEKTVLVPLAPLDAFELFTTGMAGWWPLDSHSLSATRDGQTAADVVVEPRAGGRIIETKPDGSRADWATITAWEPGHRLAFDWYVGRDASEATQVSVTFLPAPGGTQVDLVHDGFDRLGAAGTTMWTGYQTGWDMVLGACFGGAARAAALNVCAAR